MLIPFNSTIIMMMASVQLHHVHCTNQAVHSHGPIHKSNFSETKLWLKLTNCTASTINYASSAQMATKSTQDNQSSLITTESSSNQSVFRRWHQRLRNSNLWLLIMMVSKAKQAKQLPKTMTASSKTLMPTTVQSKSVFYWIRGASPNILREISRFLQCSHGRSQLEMMCKMDILMKHVFNAPTNGRLLTLISLR